LRFKVYDLTTLESIGEALQSVGYIARRGDVLGLATALHADVEQAGGSKTVILEGPPGTGKSAFAEAVAKITDSAFVAYQFHSWSDADELFVGIDVAAAVGGDAENVRQEGVLAKVAKLSHTSVVVLLLDEIDKAPERTEYLLLDWLQTGRVPIKPGVHLQTNMNRVMTFITSNNTRELSEATKRRAARVMMNPLPVKQQEMLIRTKTGLDKGFVRLLWKLARAVAEFEKNNALSTQEGIRLALAVWQHAESAGDLKLLLSQWAARSQQGRTAIAQNKFDSLVSPTWAELCRARR
jgi:MoxR-like ATPase